MRRIAALPALALAVVLAGCGGAPAAAPPSPAGKAGGGGMQMGEKPSCPPPADTSPTPQRVVTMDAGAAAFLIELGQADKIVGTAGPDFMDAFDGDLRAKLDQVEIIDEGRGNREKVLAAKPDLVTGISIYEFGAFDGTPTLEQLAENDARVVVACAPQASAEVTDMAATTAYVDALGEMFGAADEATKLNERLAAELPEQPATSKRLLALSAVPDGGQGIKTQGGTGLANGLFSLAGTKNIAGEVMSDFADLSAEQVAQQDPEVIVAVTGFGPKSPEELITAIKSSPMLAETTAVKEGRVVAVPQTILLSPSVLNPKAVNQIAQAAHK